MFTIHPYKSLGHVNHGWLDARHHFSFGGYYNPVRTGFGKLLVINDDVIMAGAGFPPHPHADMEIITYVRQGAITHKDSEGNEGRTVAGDVQVMSAGSGIRHSEYNYEAEHTNLYQIWILPNKKGVEPRWDARHFPKAPVKDALNLLVSGDGKAPLFIHQDAFIYAGRLEAGTVITHPIHHQAYILVSEGSLKLDGNLLQKGDGAEVLEDSVTIEAIEAAEVLVIDVPA